MLIERGWHVLESTTVGGNRCNGADVSRFGAAFLFRSRGNASCSAGEPGEAASQRRRSTAVDNTMARSRTPRARRSRAPLFFLAAHDRHSGHVTVVVETPKGSRNKYKYDPSIGALCLASVLGEGLAFPYDFGFVPSTLGGDGDPLDVLLFLDHGAPSGTVATAQLIGVLEVRQRTGKQPWKRNDRFLAVAAGTHMYQNLRKLADLPPHLLDEIESFFVHYAGLEGKQLEVLGRKGPRRAARLVKAGERLFRRKCGPK
ncbi:inorganic diphosphatase [Reyranella sp.]|uniref:inorganic diphosphatase n=1 Tax=Reyranella sp. TaxID=1929291 RepID=UPI002F945A70